MTDEQILKLAKSCEIEHWSRDKGECWECLEDQLLKFARAMYEEGYDQGCFEATMGVKYKRVENTQPFYDKLWGLLKTKLGDTVDCDEMSDRVRDLIREHIPEPVKNNFMSEYLLGYNEAIREVNLRLFNGIQ